MTMKNLLPKILELRKQGYSYKKIAKTIPCSISSVAYHLSPGAKLKNLLRCRKRDKDPLVGKYEKFGYIHYNGDNESSKTKNVSTLLSRKITMFGRNKKLKKYNKAAFSLEELKQKIGNNPRCYLTGDTIDLSQGRTYNLDHIIPASRGGPNSLDNVGICTKKANQSKTDMTYDEYIEHCKKVLIHQGYDVIKNSSIQNRTENSEVETPRDILFTIEPNL